MHISIRAVAFALSFGLLAGCAGPVWQTPITKETHQDVKNYVDFHIATINQIERRMEHADTKEKFVETLEYAGPAMSSLSSRRKLLVARYPALKNRNEPPSPIKEETERLFRHMREKAYVIQSLGAGAARYGSHPSVMKAIQNFMATIAQGAE